MLKYVYIIVVNSSVFIFFFFFFQAEDGIRDHCVTGVQTCALPILYPVAAEQKFDLLMALLERTNFDSVLIFCRTKQNADRVAHQLKHGKHAVAVLHSNRTQRERIEALEGFKSGKYEVMVATDIASRGLDIAGVSHVINYDVPEHPEDYVHRIGRTERAQKVGDAFTLMSGP